MATLFHGTTVENAIEIVTNGFDESAIAIWNDSEDDYTYAYSLQKVIEYEDIEIEDDDGNIIEDELENAKRQAVAVAMSNAQIAAALWSKASHTIVLEIEIDDCLVNPDTSGNGQMQNCGAVQVDTATLNKLGRIVAYHVSEFPQKLAIFCLVGIDYIQQIYFSSQSKEIYQALELLKNVEYSAISELFMELATDSTRYIHLQDINRYL